jgi:hypothetical protein
MIFIYIYLFAFIGGRTAPNIYCNFYQDCNCISIRLANHMSHATNYGMKTEHEHEKHGQANCSSVTLIISNQV